MSRRRLRTCWPACSWESHSSPPALACAACYGQSDSPMAVGMNWGIFSLLGVIACVLGGITSFFVYLGQEILRDRFPGARDGRA